MYANGDYFIDQPATVQGACGPGTTSMFNWIGFTANTNSVHDRDVDGNDFGLFIGGWRSCDDTCVGGNINGPPGLIFVR